MNFGLFLKIADASSFEWSLIGVISKIWLWGSICTFKFSVSEWNLRRKSVQFWKIRKPCEILTSPVFELWVLVGNMEDFRGKMSLVGGKSQVKLSQDDSGVDCGKFWCVEWIQNDLLGGKVLKSLKSLHNTISFISHTAALLSDCRCSARLTGRLLAVTLTPNQRIGIDNDVKSIARNRCQLRDQFLEASKISPTVQPMSRRWLNSRIRTASNAW